MKGIKTLYVTTSGALADLPFAAFITEEPKGEDDAEALSRTPWLADRFAIVNLPSVELLRKSPSRRARRNAPAFVGYGAPVLANAGTSRAAQAAGTTGAPAAGGGLVDPARLRTLPSLPGTEDELRAMAGLFDANTTAIRLGPAATEAAVRRDERLREAHVVAFATHGILPGELDGFGEPGLIFTPPDRASGPDNDGILTAAEATELRLSAEWIILSACNTATTEGPGGGDSLSGLARAFLYAGAGSLLASRWRVDDAATAALTVETMASAMQNPAAGRAAALKAAMRAVRTGKRADGTAVAGWQSYWAHPAAWAPFALIATEN